MQLPKHIHAIKRPSGKVSYYYQPFRNTPRQHERIRLPDDPAKPDFWQRVAHAERGPEPGGMTKLIDAYLASPHYASRAASTQKEYKRYLELLRKLWGDHNPRAVQPMHLAELRDTIGKDKPGKANGLIAAIGALYAWGIERGHADANPTLSVSRLSGGEYEPWPEEVWTLALEYLRPEARLACIFALYTGQRLGDVLNMKLGSVRDDTIIVRQIKTHKTLQIPLHTELKPIVAACRQRGSINIIAKRNGTAFSVDDFEALWTREMAKEPQGTIRKQGFVFHGLRKNAAIKLAEAGCTEKEISAITGMSLQMVEHYTRAANQQKLALNAMKKLEAGT